MFDVPWQQKQQNMSKFDSLHTKEQMLLKLACSVGEQFRIEQLQRFNESMPFMLLSMTDIKKALTSLETK